MTVRQSLFATFVLPALTQPARTRLTRAGAEQRHTTLHARSCRSFSHSSIRHAPSALNVDEPRDSKYKPPERRKPRNDEIRARYIQLVQEDGRLGPVTRLRDALRDLDPQTHYIEQVVPDEPQNRDFTPVCKLVDKKQAYEVEKAKRAAAKETKKAQKKTGTAGAKTFELSWAISENDLSHRLSRIQEFLAEGRRIEIVLAKKKGGRMATVEECETLLRKIRSAVDTVEGSREIAAELPPGARQPKLGSLWTLTFAGPGHKQKSKPTPGATTEQTA